LLDENSIRSRTTERIEVNNPRIRAVGRANPPLTLTQEQVFDLAGYKDERIRKIFLNSDIDRRHFYLDPENFNRENSDELNARYLRGAMETGCRAVRACLDTARITSRDIDYFLVCSCTGYVCPDVGTRLIGHMKFRHNVQRAPVVGLGCAGAIPSMQRAYDFVCAHPGRVALMLAVEICSASYYFDGTYDTVVGNAICADGAAAFLIDDNSESTNYPEIVDFESLLNPDELDSVGLGHKDGKLRIILGPRIPRLAGPMIAGAVDPLLERHNLSRSDISFWVMHPGGRKVIDGVRRHMGLSDEQVESSKRVMRNYGNMSSPTVMFVLEEVVRTVAPRPGDWGVMTALGPGMAAEAALLRW
jgi:polyketide synthase Type III